MVMYIFTHSWQNNNGHFERQASVDSAHSAAEHDLVADFRSGYAKGLSLAFMQVKQSNVHFRYIYQ